MLLSINVNFFGLQNLPKFKLFANFKYILPIDGIIQFSSAAGGAWVAGMGGPPAPGGGGPRGGGPPGAPGGGPK